MIVADYYYRDSPKPLKNFAYAGVYILRRYHSNASSFDVLDLEHVYKVGMSKNIGKRLTTYLDHGYCPFGMAFMMTSPSNAMIYERLLKKFFQTNEDTEKYRGNEWYSVHAYNRNLHGGEEWTPGATAAHSLLKAIGESLTPDDESFMEWASTYNCPIPDMKMTVYAVLAFIQSQSNHKQALCRASAHDGIRVSDKVSFREIARHFASCKLMKQTKGRALREMLQQLQRDGEIQEIGEDEYTSGGLNLSEHFAEPHKHIWL